MLELLQNIFGMNIVHNIHTDSMIDKADVLSFNIAEVKIDKQAIT